MKSNENALYRKVGESAVNISGGEKQRIAIARALYQDSKFLILDESTNALDEKTESEIFKTLYKLKNKITILIISHKNSNIEIYDKLYEVNNQSLNLK